MSREEEESYIKQHYLTIPIKRIAHTLGRSDTFVRGYMKREGLVVPEELAKERKKGRQFQKGQAPHNKGKKMPPSVYQKLQKTMFAKGQKPSNTRPFGSMRKSQHGYWEIKTKKSGRWELYHRVLWKEAYGPIPKGLLIQFRDKNPDNCTLDNLYAVTRKCQLRINKDYRGKYLDDETLNSIEALILLRETIKKKSRNEQQIERPK